MHREGGITRTGRCARESALDRQSDIPGKDNDGYTARRAPRSATRSCRSSSALMKGADSVELKLTVPEQAQRSAVRRWGSTRCEAQIRQVYFFDTPELALDKAGLVVRARRSQKKGDDSVVKLRPVVPAELPADSGASAELRRRGRRGARRIRLLRLAEGDAPTRRSCTRPRRADGRSASCSRRSSGRSSPQHAPDGVELDDLTRPRADLRPQAEVRPRGLRPQARRGDVALPGRDAHSRALDEVRAGEAFQVAAEARAFLARRASISSGEQQTKTRTALEFFSRQMREAGAA